MSSNVKSGKETDIKIVGKKGIWRMRKENTIQKEWDRESRSGRVRTIQFQTMQSRGSWSPLFFIGTNIFNSEQIMEIWFSLHYLLEIRQNNSPIHSTPCVASVAVSPYNLPSNQKRSRSVFFKWIFSDFSRKENSFEKPPAWTWRQNVFDFPCYRE